MEYKFKAGQQVRILDVESLGGREEWAGREMTLKRQDSDGWDEPGWSVREKECHYRFRESELALVSPIRTETVTTRRIEPGVYGLLQVAEGMRPKTVHVYAHDSATASELRDLARVATELAEFLDAQ